MRKLVLQLEALKVESFETGAEEEARGTVHANASQFCTRFNLTCNGGYTCDGGYTCGGNTCVEHSCDGACGSYYCASGESCSTPSCLETCAPRLTCELGCI